MIELAGVRVEHPRGGAPLLDGADLVVGRGQVVLLGAAAGAGSSRLCAVLTGEVAASTGRVELFGRDLRRLRRASLLRLRRRVGIVPQDLRLLGDASALANVLLPLDIDHVPRREASIRALEALGRVGLAAELDVRVDRLSMAERQRVAAGGTSVLIASRDEALWAAAGELGWRRMLLRDGKIEAMEIADFVIDPVDEIVVEHDVLDSAPLEIAAEATPLPRPMPDLSDSDTAIPNVLPFPITTRGVAAR